MIEANLFLLQAFNTVLILLVGILLKHELNDIKTRIVRMENKFMNGRNDEWEP